MDDKITHAIFILYHLNASSVYVKIAFPYGTLYDYIFVSKLSIRNVQIT